MQRRSFLLSSAAALAQGTALAQAQAPSPSSWPARPVRMLIGYPPGGSTDVAGRLLAEQLGRKLGQQVVVVRRQGCNTGQR